MRTKIRYLIAGMILLLAVPAMSSGTGGFLLDTAPENTAESNPFEFLAEATRSNIGPGQNSVIAVSVRIASGHKLYASKMGIEPGDVPGVVFGKLETPDSVEKEEPDGKTARFYVGDVSFFLPVSIDPSVEIGPLTVPLTVLYQGCSDTRCFFPQEKQLTVSLNIEATAVAGTPPVLPVISENTAGGLPEENPYERAARRFGLLGVLAAAFMWGVLASMTPCIYPMIPVTMSVIGAASTGSPARGFTLSLIYVLGMSLVYAAFGIAAAWSGSLFGALSDHPAVRIVVSGVFVLLALSLFDLFHIRMPAWVASRLGGKFGGGIIGVFLTGAAAGAVVGPCVGPLLVALLVYIATLGDKFQGFLIMWSFALGMGALFLVIGTFSSAAASLPKSGPWMERLKQVFGVLMLGAALYYIAPLMPERVVLLCIGAFLISVGTFIGALDALPLESGGYERLKKSAGILCLTLGIAYVARFALTGVSVPPTPRAAGPPGISWMKNEADALLAADRQKKPVLIDFYADWCAACRDLDEDTFADPKVIAAARGFVALRVDSSDPMDPAAVLLRKKYGIIGLPTIVFLGSGGRVISDETITEFVPAGHLLARMDQVRAAFSE